MVEDYIKGWCKMKCKIHGDLKYVVFAVENVNDVSRRSLFFLASLSVESKTLYVLVSVV